MRYAVGIEYSGGAYCGWQRQPHCVSIQQLLEEAVEAACNMAGDAAAFGSPGSARLELAVKPPKNGMPGL